MNILTIVTADVDQSQGPELITAYEMLLAGGLPDGLLETQLLGDGQGHWAIHSLSRGRAALDAIGAASEPPAAPALFRGFSAEPTWAIMPVLVDSRGQRRANALISRDAPPPRGASFRRDSRMGVTRERLDPKPRHLASGCCGLRPAPRFAIRNRERSVLVGCESRLQRLEEGHERGLRLRQSADAAGWQILHPRSSAKGLNGPVHAQVRCQTVRDPLLELDHGDCVGEPNLALTPHSDSLSESSLTWPEMHHGSTSFPAPAEARAVRTAWALRRPVRRQRNR